MKRKIKIVKIHKKVNKIRIRNQIKIKQRWIRKEKRIKVLGKDRKMNKNDF